VEKWKIREEAIIGIGWGQLKGQLHMQILSPETTHTWRIYYVFSSSYNLMYSIHLFKTNTNYIKVYQQYVKRI